MNDTEIQVILNYKGEIGISFPEKDLVATLDPHQAEKMALALLKAAKSRYFPWDELETAVVHREELE